MFKEKASKRFMFNMPKLFIIIVINLDYILDKNRASYTISKRENPLLNIRDSLLKLQGKILVLETLQ